ncbi:RNA polymerase II transcription factor B subunit 1 [Spiromyces aspiralis]|uniref:RNA polymerase II transcription factor B subunit 1 n=1 Tax=Spiromyces aspiralis TaxID=68401 RepID=A0ACC1HWH2_9FUNG|nr:RNA polymerase II transcription factor B subunit 1 [Spiromyces aspiralis]
MEEKKEEKEYSCVAYLDKKKGTLYLTNKRLVWRPAVQGERQPFSAFWHQIKRPQTNKDGGKTPKLRISYASDQNAGNDAPMTFAWAGADKEQSVRERNKVMELILRKTQRMGQAQSGTPTTVSGASTPVTARSGSAEAGKGSPTPGASTVKSKINEAAIKPGSKSVPPEELELRQMVLARNKDLAKLHKSLVIAGYIKEDEFWTARQHLLDEQRSIMNQRRGPSSSLLEITPNTQDNGNFKYTLTPDIARKIFKQYPQGKCNLDLLISAAIARSVVKRAYIENVPHKVTEKQFWKRFFASRFFNRNRSATVAMKAEQDPIFDKCIEEEDASLESVSDINPKTLFRLLDLTQNEADGYQSGNLPDFTVKSGRNQENLSLMRRFNRHSQKVLSESLDTNAMVTARDKDMSGLVSGDTQHSDVGVIVKQIELEDLEEVRPLSRIKLNITDQSRYFESQSQLKRKREEEEPKNPAEKLRLVQEQTSNFDVTKLTEIRLDSVVSVSVMSEVNGAIHSKATQYRPGRVQDMALPNELTQAISGCHSIGSERLRHLWALIAPPRLPSRLNKATKVVETLRSLRRKVKEIIAKAQSVKDDYGQQTEQVRFVRAIEEDGMAFMMILFGLTCAMFRSNPNEATPY